MRLSCTVLFLCLVCVSPAAAQSPGDLWQFGVGPHVVFREGSSKTNVGGGVTVARRFERFAAVLEAGGTRREGHNDWRLVAGPRLTLGSGSSPTFFIQALAGTLIRQRDPDWAVLPGFGVDVHTAGGRAFRLQFDAPIERAESRTVAGVRASVWFLF